MTAITMPRVFKMGGTLLADPDPFLTPEDVVALYSVNYPHLANATVADPTIENDQIVYPILKPPAESKGLSIL